MIKFSKQKFTIYLSLIFIIISFLSFSYFLGKKNSKSLPVSIIITISRPFLKAGQFIASKVKRLFENYIILVKVKKENEELKRKVYELERELIYYKELAQKAERLRELFHFQFSSGFESLPANVIGKDLSGVFLSIIIDRGSKDNVKENMVVINERGIIGQIIRVYPNASQVLLIQDRNSAVAVILQKSRAQGILIGRGFNKNPIILYIDKSYQIELGETVITSGMDEIYPKGLKVGKVKSIIKEPEEIFQKVEVQTDVSFNNLEEVLILMNSNDYLPPLPSSKFSLGN